MAYVFEVGQLVESRYFLIGYRGAWFQCKIKDIGWRMGTLSYELEFVDFPDEKVVWTKLFQKPPAAFGIQSMGSKGQLMMRPQFPRVYREKELSDVSTNSEPEVIVVVNDIWKVGDLVDWWKDSCYWSGKIIAILGGKRVKVELLPPPFGEGLTYEAFCKDLRPSLDWSLESGWTVPIIKVNGSAQCARVLKRVHEGPNKSENGNGSQAAAGKSHVSLASQSPTIGPGRMLKRPHSDMALKEKHRDILEVSTDSDHVNGVTAARKTSSLDNISTSPARVALSELLGATTAAEGCNDDWSLKKTIPDISLNSMHDDSLEAAILDLEELINRIKWIKGMCDFETPLPNTSASGSPWEFVEHRPSFTRK